MNPLKDVFSFLFSIFIWVFITCTTVITWFLVLLVSPFDHNQRIGHAALTRSWAWLNIRVNPFWRMTIKGRSHLKHKKAYVIVANHSSLADILCLFCLGRNFKWMAKDSLFKIPFFGWTMSLNRYIPLERGKHSSIKESVALAKYWLARGVSVLIFPEGTRSKTGEMGTFKNGAFKLALETGIPIAPVVVYGTAAGITKGKATMSTRANVKVKVLPPIETSSWDKDDFEGLKEKVASLMKQELELLRG